MAIQGVLSNHATWHLQVGHSIERARDSRNMVLSRRFASRDALVNGCGPARRSRRLLSPNAEIRSGSKRTRWEELQSTLRRFSRPPHLVPARIVALAQFLLACLPVASADAGAKRQETFVVHLVPRENCVGRPTQIASARSEFEVGPGIRHVCGWDWDWRESRFAGSSITKRPWTFQGSTSSMGAFACALAEPIRSIGSDPGSRQSAPCQPSQVKTSSPGWDATRHRLTKC